MQLAMHQFVPHQLELPEVDVKSQLRPTSEVCGTHSRDHHHNRTSIYESTLTQFLAFRDRTAGSANNRSHAPEEGSRPQRGTTNTSTSSLSSSLTQNQVVNTVDVALVEDAADVVDVTIGIPRLA